MGKTIAEKIFSIKSKSDAKAGDVIMAQVDAAMSNDASGPLTIEIFHDMDAKITMIFRFGIAERAPTDILGESSCIMVECRKQGRPSLLGSKPFLSDDGMGMS